jgi:[ribosomal protein S5]-alanine N-acetyltransferase
MTAGARVKPRVAIAPLTAADGAEFVAAARASKRLHAAWVAPPLTLADYRAKLQRTQPPLEYGFGIRRVDSGALVGYVGVTNVVRGNFLSAYLGYYAFAGHERQGLMGEGLTLVARYAFGTLGLHRLEANIQPDNRPSLALVQSCGFAKEGYSPRYLKIGGRWRDHERWALLAR